MYIPTLASLGHYIQRKQLVRLCNSISFLSPFIPFLGVVTKSNIPQKRFNLGLNKINTTYYPFQNEIDTNIAG